jgi:hypothetical protein
MFKIRIRDPTTLGGIEFLPDLDESMLERAFRMDRVSRHTTKNVYRVVGDGEMRRYVMSETRKMKTKWRHVGDIAGINLEA